MHPSPSDRLTPLNTTKDADDAKKRLRLLQPSSSLNSRILNNMMGRRGLCRFESNCSDFRY